MLSKIKIKNYALINELEVSFTKGFSVITGETGAGKSIILGALGLTLGERTDTSIVKNNESKCIIETWFLLKNLNLQSFFNENELDYEDETILRREILPSGKSRAFINDTPVSLTTLKQLSEKLIDVHSQHQTLLLNKNSFQLLVIDSNAKNESILNEYSTIFKKYNSVSKELTNLKEKEAKMKGDLDYFQFQFNELEEANLENSNEEELENELMLLNNTEEIKLNLSNSIGLIDSENGVVIQLQEIENYLAKIANTSKQTRELNQRISSVLIEIQDIQNEAESLNESVVYNPERIEIISENLNQIFSLHQKHRTNSVQELIEIKNQLEKKLVMVSGFDLAIKKLENKQNDLLNSLKKIGIKLTNSRKKIIPQIEKNIKTLLGSLSMPNSELKILLEENKEFSISGKDNLSFLFKANKGSMFNAIHKVASGGELSRLMLCIKNNLALNKALPTLIFDEIDSGVSGDIASKMGDMMRKIGETTQVISITHLAQIASKGNSHYFVYKEVEEEVTQTNIRVLSKEDRVEEVAKMLSGTQITSAAIENAKSLIAQ